MIVWVIREGKNEFPPTYHGIFARRTLAEVTLAQYRDTGECPDGTQVDSWYVEEREVIGKTDPERAIHALLDALKGLQ